MLEMTLHFIVIIKNKQKNIYIVLLESIRVSLVRVGFVRWAIRAVRGVFSTNLLYHSNFCFLSPQIEMGQY